MRSCLTTPAHGIPAASRPSRQPTSRAAVTGYVAARLALGRQRAGVVVVDGAEGDDPDAGGGRAPRGAPRPGGRPPRSSMPTKMCSPVRGSSTITSGSRRSIAAARSGSSTGSEYAQKPLDDRLAHRGAVLAAAARRGRSPAEDQHRIPGLLGGARETLQEEHGAGIAERVAERLREQQPDRLAAARAQAARGGVRPGVAELRRRGQDPLAQLGRELVRPVVGVGDRGARDAEVLGDGLQGHLARHGLPSISGSRGRTGACGRPDRATERVRKRESAAAEGEEEHGGTFLYRST